MTDLSHLFSGIAIGLTFLAFGPYIYSILAGRTRPHVFSWVIWGITTIIVFQAQLADGGGVGAWPIGLSGLITIFVAVLAYFKKGDMVISRVDWLFLLLALGSLPLWFFTASPFLAVLLLTLIDLFGLGPTFRKAYDHPYEEQLLFFWLMMLRNLFAVAALARFTPATVTFPLVMAVACLVLIVVVGLRRREVGRREVGPGPG